MASEVLCLFFFSSRGRHTGCSRDWSSDVCSSDLHRRDERHVLLPIVGAAHVQAAPVRAMGFDGAVEVIAVEVIAVAAPDGAVADGGATGIEQDQRRVKAVPLARRSIDAPAI